jgi:hypothetical protein
MYLRTRSDSELRMLLNVEPDNLEFVYEGADRFRNAETIDLPKDCGDVSSGFPDEDFAGKVLDRLRRFADTLKGSAKAECLMIITDLEDLEQEIANSVEYGREELRKVEDALAEYAESRA